MPTPKFGTMSFDEMVKLCGLKPVAEFDDQLKDNPPSSVENRRTGRTTQILIKAFVKSLQHGRRILIVTLVDHHTAPTVAYAKRLAGVAKLDTSLISGTSLHRLSSYVQGRPEEDVIYDHSIPLDSRASYRALAPRREPL